MGDIPRYCDNRITLARKREDPSIVRAHWWKLWGHEYDTNAVQEALYKSTGNLSPEEVDDISKFQYVPTNLPWMWEYEDYNEGTEYLYDEAEAEDWDDFRILLEEADFPDIDF